MTGATTTTIYAIDYGRDVLVTMADPNSGVMTTVGALGVNTTGDVGFDIAGNNGSAYVTLTVGGGFTGSTLYQMNLVSGALFPVGGVANSAPLRVLRSRPDRSFVGHESTRGRRYDHLRPRGFLMHLLNGAYRDRTDDLTLAKRALSQLS